MFSLEASTKRSSRRSGSAHRNTATTPRSGTGRSGQPPSPTRISRRARSLWRLFITFVLMLTSNVPIPPPRHRMHLIDTIVISEEREHNKAIPGVPRFSKKKWLGGVKSSTCGQRPDGGHPKHRRPLGHRPEAAEPVRRSLRKFSATGPERSGAPSGASALAAKRPRHSGRRLVGHLGDRLRRARVRRELGARLGTSRAVTQGCGSRFSWRMRSPLRDSPPTATVTPMDAALRAAPRRSAAVAGWLRVSRS